MAQVPTNFSVVGMHECLYNTRPMAVLLKLFFTLEKIFSDIHVTPDHFFLNEDENVEEKNMLAVQA